MSRYEQYLQTMQKMQKMTIELWFKWLEGESSELLNNGAGYSVVNDV